MMDPQPYIEKASRKTGLTIKASAPARYRLGDDLSGHDGLLCAAQDALIFVEDHLLKPGQVKLHPTAAIFNYNVQQDILGARLELHTKGGVIIFSDVDTAALKNILDTVGLNSEQLQTATDLSAAPWSTTPPTTPGAMPTTQAPIQSPVHAPIQAPVQATVEQSSILSNTPWGTAVATSPPVSGLSNTPWSADELPDSSTDWSQSLTGDLSANQNAVLGIEKPPWDTGIPQPKAETPPATPVVWDTATDTPEPAATKPEPAKPEPAKPESNITPEQTTTDQFDDVTPVSPPADSIFAEDVFQQWQEVLQGNPEPTEEPPVHRQASSVPLRAIRSIPADERVLIRWSDQEFVISPQDFIQGIRNKKFGKRTRFTIVGSDRDFVRLGECALYRLHRPRKESAQTQPDLLSLAELAKAADGNIDEMTLVNPAAKNILRIIGSIFGAGFMMPIFGVFWGLVIGAGGGFWLGSFLGNKITVSKAK